MLRRFGHWLMWGMFVALQALTPFMHAHASPVQTPHVHADFLHLHVTVTAGHDWTEPGHAAVLTVMQGILPRGVAALPVPPVVKPFSGLYLNSPPLLPGRNLLVDRGGELPAPPPHCRPLTLAPPTV